MHSHSSDAPMGLNYGVHAIERAMGANGKLQLMLFDAGSGQTEFDSGTSKLHLAMPTEASEKTLLHYHAALCMLDGPLVKLRRTMPSEKDDAFAKYRWLHQVQLTIAEVAARSNKYLWDMEQSDVPLFTHMYDAPHMLADGRKSPNILSLARFNYRKHFEDLDEGLTDAMDAVRLRVTSLDAQKIEMHKAIEHYKHTTSYALQVEKEWHSLFLSGDERKDQNVRDNLRVQMEHWIQLGETLDEIARNLVAAGTQTEFDQYFRNRQNKLSATVRTIENNVDRLYAQFTDAPEELQDAERWQHYGRAYTSFMDQNLRAKDSYDSFMENMKSNPSRPHDRDGSNPQWSR